MPRRSRGAIDRHRATTGAAWGAAGRSRASRACGGEIPGVGKGLKSPAQKNVLNRHFRSSSFALGRGSSLYPLSRRHSSDSVWFGSVLVWFGSVSSVWFSWFLMVSLVWFGSVSSVWFCLVWFGLVRFGSVWFGLVWFGLVRFGLVRFGSVRFG